MKLQLKRSNVLDGGKAKEPTPPFVEYGELCVNYNVSDPALFIKDSNDNIIRIAGKNSIGIGGNPSGPDNPSTGNNIGDVFFNTGDLTLYYWDGSDWVPIASGDDNGFWSRDPDNGHLYPTYLTDKVGIGTNEPSTTLQVKQKSDDSAGGIRLARSNGNASYTQWVNTDSVFNIGYSNPATTNPTEAHLSVTVHGNVGIGNSSPAAKLQVKSAAENESCRLENGRHTLRFKNVKTGTGTDWNAYQQILEHGVDTTTQEFIKFGSGGDSSTTRINLGTLGDSNLMHLVNDRVGIGKTNPAVKLDINGKARSNSTVASDNGTTLVTKDYLSSAGSGGSGAFGYWTRSGTNLYNTNLSDQVGIGTNSPKAKLTVDGNAYIGNSTRNYVGIYETDKGGSIEAFAAANTATKKNLFLNAYGGNVGIGTDSPNLRLSVTGPRKAAFTDFPFCVEITSSENFAQGVGGGISFRGKDTASNVSDFGFIAGVKENATSGNYAGALILGSRAAGSAGSGHEKMRIASNGNVGIGTTNPGKKLDVNGEGRVKDIFTVTGGGAKVICGEGGAVGLSCNDGGGNANVTFNHMGNKADQDGNAARIVVNTDASTNPTFDFILYEGVTSGTEGTKVHPLVLKKNGAKITGSLEVTGKATSASTASSDGGKTLVTKDYLENAIANSPGTIVCMPADLPAAGERADGLLWYNLDDGRLYVWFTDVGGSSQFVDASPDSQTEQHWDRDSTTNTLSPKIANDSIALGTGSITGSTVTCTGRIQGKDIRVEENATNTCQMAEQGYFSSNRAVDSYTCYRAYLQSKENFTVYASGETKFFTNNLNAGSANGFGVKVFKVGNAGEERGQIELQNTSTSTSTGKVLYGRRGSTINWYMQANGKLHTTGSVFMLEPDDPANYISAMVDGEEEQVYAGPTLDVKEKLLEFIDRINDLEEQKASLEARITALEGGN